MEQPIAHIKNEEAVKQVYEKYANKMLVYATRTWQIETDTAWELIYATIYKVTEVEGQYSFENEQKYASFTFKVFINKIRDHLRQVKNQPKPITDTEVNERIINNRAADAKSKATPPSPALKALQTELDKLEEWQRILVLMRSQDMSYSHIAQFVNKPEKQLKVYYGRIKQQLAERLNHLLTKTTDDKQ